MVLPVAEKTKNTRLVERLYMMPDKSYEFRLVPVDGEMLVVTRLNDFRTPRMEFQLSDDEKEIMAVYNIALSPRVKGFTERLEEITGDELKRLSKTKEQDKGMAAKTKRVVESVDWNWREELNVPHPQELLVASITCRCENVLLKDADDNDIFGRTTGMMVEVLRRIGDQMSRKFEPKENVKIQKPEQQDQPTEADKLATWERNMFKHARRSKA